MLSLERTLRFGTPFDLSITSQSDCFVRLESLGDVTVSEGNSTWLLKENPDEARPLAPYF